MHASHFTATGITATKLAHLGRDRYEEQTLEVATYTAVDGTARYEAARRTEDGLFPAGIGSSYKTADEVLAAIARSDAATRAHRDGARVEVGNAAERAATRAGAAYGVGGQVWDE